MGMATFMHMGDRES